MDLKTLKLHLITRILQTDDAQVLQALAGILEPESAIPSHTAAPVLHPPVFPPIAPSAPSSAEAREIQHELDQLFTS